MPPEHAGFGETRSPVFKVRGKYALNAIAAINYQREWWPNFCKSVSDPVLCLVKPKLEAVNLVPANIFVSVDSLIVSLAIVMLGMVPLRAIGLCTAFSLDNLLARIAARLSHESSPWLDTPALILLTVAICL